MQVMNDYKKIIRRAIRFIEANLKEEIRVDDIARESCYSLFHFTRMFTELTGETPGVYLRRRRLEEAASEIRAGRDIIEVALDYRFGSQEGFTRSFKAHHRTTPGFHKKRGLDSRSSILNKLKEVVMSKKLENLRWKARWTSHLGCIKGCLNYLDLDVSDAWLFGATGHAFVINVHDQLCPSGPTAWDTQMLSKLGKNVGYKIDGVNVHKSQGDFGDKQKEAWDLGRRSVDEGTPCYGWELEVPEFYVILGYDDTGYYYSGPGCDLGKGPKPWQELGDTEIGVIEMYSVRPGQAADDVKTVKEALEFALEHARNSGKSVDSFTSRYKTGLDGYDNWINALEVGTADGLGMAYNTAVWTECRGFGTQFLREARGRLSGEAGALLEEATEQYGKVYQHLERVANLFPFPPGNEIDDEERCNKAVAHLRNARDNEEAGLELLEKIAIAL